MGTVRIGLWQGIQGILSEWHGNSSVLTDLERTILFSIRLPRALFAGIVGASLSLAGVVFQALLRNPLADPYILGISGGSAVGAMAGIIIGAGALTLGTAGFAFLGALVTIFLVLGIAGRGRVIQSTTLLLSGVIINAFFSALIMILIAISSNADLHNVMFWLMGDLSVASRPEMLAAAFFLLLGFVVIYGYGRALNLITTGEETAMQLGVNVESAKRRLLVTASLVTAAAVSMSGIIGFVGLMIPHMMRMTVGPDHRLLLPAATLFGASFLALADTIARTAMAPTELPVGVITALCGAPYFIFLLRRRVF
ncbi:MAG: iron chelate uptake ABC transporter family permease subunit [Deltaproteobacteria bacterium]|nr:iron chelate uptake ABC transporter family permease subunit [Deltaproteobacteria bacterium]